MLKIHHGENRIHLIREWIVQCEAQGDIKTILALSKAFQEAAEVSMDLLAMLLKDISIPPRDDYTNVGAAVEADIVSGDLGGVLREANGLRNRLIHVYNDVNTRVLLESVKRLQDGLTTYLEVVEKWLDEARRA
jgi:uncharacterized protein YutE (UPF0331/DUF86 family)